MTTSGKPIETRGRPGRAEDPRSGQPAQHLAVQGARRLADQPAVQRGLFRAADQDRRRAGEPAADHPGRQALRSAEILRADQPSVGRLLVHRQRPHVAALPAGAAEDRRRRDQCRRAAAARRHQDAERGRRGGSQGKGAGLHDAEGGHASAPSCASPASMASGRASSAPKLGVCSRTRSARSLELGGQQPGRGYAVAQRRRAGRPSVRTHRRTRRRAAAAARDRHPRQRRDVALPVQRAAGLDGRAGLDAVPVALHAGRGDRLPPRRAHADDGRDRPRRAADAGAAGRRGAGGRAAVPPADPAAGVGLHTGRAGRGDAGAGD